jgi:predicted ATPase
MDMLDNLQNSFRVTKPDPDLLSTPFEVQTNWHVITGAPCSGKTTLIDQLANQGFQTVPEAARQYFEQEMASGRTIDEPCQIPLLFTGSLALIRMRFCQNASAIVMLPYSYLTDSLHSAE